MPAMLVVGTRRQNKLPTSEWFASNAFMNWQARSNNFANETLSSRVEPARFAHAEEPLY
jgi:hypothetical protein